MESESQDTGPAAMKRSRIPAIELIKPRITLMVLITTGAGLWFAEQFVEAASGLKWLAALLGTTLIVGSANTFNSWIERESDKLMTRTATRPLPSSRISPKAAMSLGVLLFVLSVPTLLYVNVMTLGLGLLAWVLYVGVYTPMKKRSAQAILVGAIPGAMPPLMGWTAITGQVDLAGLALFAVLFFWQLPHFMAIAIFREHEYTRAGIRVTPAEHGFFGTVWRMALYTAALVPSTLLLLGFEGVGWLYGATALVLGTSFTLLCLVGFQTLNGTPDVQAKWARRVFFASLIYLPGLLGALVLDGVIS